jgi:hypothetical protein
MDIIQFSETSEMEPGGSLAKGTQHLISPIPFLARIAVVPGGRFHRTVNENMHVRNSVSHQHVEISAVGEARRTDSGRLAVLVESVYVNAGCGDPGLT